MKAVHFGMPKFDYPSLPEALRDRIQSLNDSHKQFPKYPHEIYMDDYWRASFEWYAPFVAAGVLLRFGPPEAIQDIDQWLEQLPEDAFVYLGFLFEDIAIDFPLEIHNFYYPEFSPLLEINFSLENYDLMDQIDSCTVEVLVDPQTIPNSGVHGLLIEIDSLFAISVVQARKGELSEAEHSQKRLNWIREAACEFFTWLGRSVEPCPYIRMVRDLEPESWWAQF